MKRFLALALTCLLAACTSQHRVDPEPDFANPNPAHDENPAEPRLGEIESLISQAKLEIKRRDHDEARVKLHQVFRRDRWNPEANTIYQDLQISSGKGDALYQEYLDLYEANKTRGDALWFHLRPLLIKRGIKACEVEKHAEMNESQRERIREIRKALGVGIVSTDRPTAELTEAEKSALVTEWLKLDPWDAAAVAFLTKMRPKETVESYRRMAEEQSESGDAQWLYSRCLSALETEEGDAMALDVLRKAWVLELPGVMLLGGIAGTSLGNATRWLPVSKERVRQATEAYGWLALAIHFARLVELTDPESGYGETIKVRVLEAAAENSIELEDLSQRD